MNILETVTLSCLVAGLVIHYYLDYFFDQRLLPYSAAFSVFVNVFALGYTVALIWMFGVLVGLILALACYFQILFSTVLWIFLVPNALKMLRATSPLKVNAMVHWLHSKFAVAMVILAVVTIVHAPYAASLRLFNGHYTIVIAMTVGVLVIGSFLRIATMAALTKK